VGVCEKNTIKLSVIDYNAMIIFMI